MSFYSFLKSASNYFSFTNSPPIVKQLTSPTEQDYIDYGMTSLTPLTTPTTSFIEPMESQGAVGTGTLWKKSINVAFYDNTIEEVR